VQVTLVPVAVLFAGSIFAGLYPAWELSRLELRNAGTAHSSGSRLNYRVRNLLVIVQFAVSLLMVTWMYMVFTQLNYVRSLPLGFEQEAQLIIRDSEVYDSLYDARSRQFSQELKRLPGVKQTTSTATLPGEKSLWYSSNVKPLSNLSRDPITLDFTLVDMHFIETYGLTQVAGPGMNETHIPRKTICLNTSAVKALGFSSPEEAIDQQILFFNDTARIVSIIDDFYFFSPREGTHPLAFLYAPDQGIYFVVHTVRNQMTEVNRQAEALFKQIYPGQPYFSEPLTDYYNQQYKADESFEKALSVFTALSVCITCLGLIAMAAFITEVRRKEIGIRKTLGASSGNVVLMLLRQYMWLMVLAAAIAVPASWWVGRQWLDQFANRIGLTPQLILLPAVVMLLIVLATVSFQTWRAARTNPMDAIRYE
jgi:putative ABC transport system permease protein